MGTKAGGVGEAHVLLGYVVDCAEYDFDAISGCCILDVDSPYHRAGRQLWR